MAGRKRKKGGKGKPQARRVLIRQQATDYEAWELDYARSGMTVRLHPVCRLTDDGPEYGKWPQPGDQVAYGMYPFPERADDCFTAAIATAVQQPIEQVPDLHIDDRVRAGEDPVDVSDSSWERIERWANGHGLTLTFHDDVLPVDRERWIGVVPDPKGSWMLGDHCLVMSGDRLVFDPSISVRQPPGKRRVSFDSSDITYGVSFDREET